MELKPGDLVLVKADAFKGRRKIKDRWEDKACEVVHQIMQLASPPMKWQTNVDSHTSSTTINFFSCCIRDWHSLVCGCLTKHGTRCTSPTPVKPTPKGSESKIMPQLDSGLVTHPACQASKISLGWINGKLWLLLMDIHRSIHRWQVKTSGNV